MNKTMILAIGGAGCNIAEYCKCNASSGWLKNACFLFADTDIDNITRLDRDGYQTLTLQPNSPLIPYDRLTDGDNIVILAGLGGKTGSNFVESAAKAARLAGIENVALIVTMPFPFEGDNKTVKAAEVLESLSDFLVRTLRNEDLIERYPDLNFINAFEYSDKEALKAIESGDI